MIIETVFVASLIALSLYGGTRWLRAGVEQYDADFRSDVLKQAAQIAAMNDQSLTLEIERAFNTGQPTTNVLRVECVLRKVSPSLVERTIVVAILNPHAPGIIRRSTRVELEWDELPSQVRADFIQHGTHEQVYLLYDNTERNEDSNV